MEPNCRNYVLKTWRGYWEKFKKTKANKNPDDSYSVILLTELCLLLQD